MISHGERARDGRTGPNDIVVAAAPSACVRHHNAQRKGPRLHFYTMKDLDGLPQLKKLDAERRWAMKVVAQVLPFRTNSYVVEELIDWQRVPDDPLFQLTFPQPGMLKPGHFSEVADALAAGVGPDSLRALVNRIRLELNPHPSGQMQYNLAVMDDEPVSGVQHKYERTCLVFPSAGQTCHAYCTFCFRWAQFVGIRDLKFATDEAMRFRDYLRRQRDVTDVLITGGDPMVMRADVLARYVEPLLEGPFDHIHTIRFGTKALSYWPYRFLTDEDSDDLLRLFEKIVSAGKHLAIMAHFSHWRELNTDAARAAISRLRATGAIIRTQSPLLRHINDTPEVWARLWQDQVRLGCLPYYMFVERDTGAERYFKVPLSHAWEIYRDASAQTSGLGRTARGPTMSATPGKVVIDGVAEISGRKVFVLSFIQARRPGWTKRPFFAEFDPAASWLSDLRPAFGAREFFYESELREILNNRSRQAEPEASPMLLDSGNDPDGLSQTVSGGTTPQIEQVSWT